MKKLSLLLLCALLCGAAAYSKSVAKVTLAYEESLHNGLLKSNKSGYEIDSLVIKGYFRNEDFASLRDYINNGKLRGIDMSGVENLSTVPSGAFSTAKVNGSDNVAGNDTESQMVCKLEYITLPSWVREISDRAFMMSSLRCINMPKLTRIGCDAFSGCKNLKSVTFHQTDVPCVADGHAFGNLSGNAVLYVPTGTAWNFRNSADFYNFSSIEEDGSLFMIKEFNLDENSQPLETLLGDDMLKVDSIRITGYLPKSDVRALRLGACYGRLSGIDLSDCRIENDALPDGSFISVDDPPYTPSESYLMDVAHNLRFFRFPKGLKSIGGNAFMKARFLSIEFPSSLDKIDASAFQDGRLEGNLIIPEGVTWMVSQAFDGNSVKGDVYLPSTLAYVDNCALGIISNENIKSGKNFYYNRMTPPVQKTQRSDYYPLLNSNYASLKMLSKSDWTLYVPVGAKAAFAADANWGQFPNIVETSKLDGGTSGIAATTASANKYKDSRIYTLDGRYAGSDINSLGKGVYVLNGKKFVK